MDLEPLEMVLVALAGVGAGVINTIVGSGTLITFPTLVAFGVPPVTATMSNAVGLVPGNVTGSWGYRRELAGQRRRLLTLLPASLLGALTGAFLLLHLPEDAFETVVPALLVLALLLVVLQPLLQRTMASRAARADPAGTAPTRTYADGTPRLSRSRTVVVVLAVYACGVYGGYFAAAQGVLLVGLLGLLLPETLQRVNGAKNVLVLAVNAVAATTYVVVSSTGGRHQLDWVVAGLVAGGSLVGGVLGARFGRRLPAGVLRALIVLLGCVALFTVLGL